MNCDDGRCSRAVLAARALRRRLCADHDPCGLRRALRAERRGGGGAPVGAERSAERRVRARVAGREGHGTREVPARLRHPRLVGARVAERHVRGTKGRTERQRGAEARRRLVGPPQSPQHDPQVVKRPRVGRSQAARAAVPRLRLAHCAESLERRAEVDDGRAAARSRARARPPAAGGARAWCRRAATANCRGRRSGRRCACRRRRARRWRR